MKAKKWVKWILYPLAVIILGTVILSLFASEKTVSAVEWKYYTQTSCERAAGDGIGFVQGTETFSGRDHVFTLAEGKEIGFELSVPEDGEYTLRAGYLPVPGKGHDMEYRLYIDGALYGTDETILTLGRLWRDEGGITQTANGNDLRPRQAEAYIWTEQPLRDPNAIDGQATFCLTAGLHSFRLVSVRESVILDYFYLKELKPLEPYSEYIARYASAEALTGISLTLQAENAYIKSAAAIYPTYDRTSPITQPYHATELRLNTIGASGWDEVGQWITWQFDVQKDGMYKIGLRYHQNELKGYYVSRSILLDGEIPFDEFADVHFNYDGNWRFDYLSDAAGDPYLVYLTAGTHQLTFEVTLGTLAEVLGEMQQTVYALNNVYREIIMITGTEPDFYRDYHLETAIPGLTERLAQLSDELTGYQARMDKLFGAESTAGEIIQLLVYQLDRFAAYPYKIQNGLTTFQTNISSFAEWLLSIQKQPLEMDYIVVASPDTGDYTATANVFSRIRHEIFAFFGSFTQNYNALSTEEVDDRSNTVITVWMSTGRDQAYVANRLIEEYFTPETGIYVDLQLVSGALLKATIAGEGPDVNLFTGRGEVMNLAFRGALASLNGLEGFDEAAGQYHDGAMLPYEYDGNTYGMPETQDFFVMFCRDDILQELGLAVPDTWEELMDIAPILQSNNLGIGLPYYTLDGNTALSTGVGTTSLFPSLLLQHGGSLYTPDHRATLLGEPVAYEAFKQWTDFYTQYGYALYKDDFTRFRTGEMPVIICSYGMYARLADTAPEIYGKWHMYLLPGTVGGDGGVNRACASNGTAAIVLAQNTDTQASWEFVKWWCSAETQALYAQDIEADLGLIGRYTSCNKEAFERSSWSYQEQKTLEAQWNSVIELPEIPGGYYVSRNLDNAFRAVVISYGNARENLFYWTNSTDEEITRKRTEMGID